MVARVLPWALVLSLVSFAGCAADGPEEIGGATEAICCGANCCLIDGSCTRRGDTNPANSCEMCDPSSSNTSWTAVAGCAADASPPADTGPADTGTAADTGTGGGGDGGCSVGRARGGAAALGFASLLAVTLLRRRRA